MTIYDDYFTHDDKPFAENLNDALLVSNVFDLTVPIEVPTMFSNSAWVDSTSQRKCGVAIATLKESLPSGVSVSTSGGKSVLTGTGTVKLGFYPNFASFGKYKSISWTGSGNIVVNLKTTGGTTIASNIANGTITSESSELRQLQEIVIEIVLTSATLNGLTVVMENKQQERYGAECGISDVTGLQSSLDAKVNISDIKNNLTSSDTNKPLSANMGKSLKDGLDSHNHDSRYYTESEIDDKFGWVEITNTADFSYVDSETTAKLEVNQTLRLAHLTFTNNHDYQMGANLYTIGIGFLNPTYRPTREIFVPAHNSGKYLCIIPSKADDFPMCQMRKDTSYNGTVTTYVDIIYKY